MRRQTFAQSVLREEWDDDTRTYRAWDATGKLTTTRAYTAVENTAADQAAEAAAAPAAGPDGWYTVTIDVGAIAVPSAQGTFTHPGLPVGTRIMALLSPIMPPGKDEDEWEMVDVGVRMLVQTPGVISYVMTGRDGHMSGAYNINYLTSG